MNKFLNKLVTLSVAALAVTTVSQSIAGTVCYDFSDFPDLNNHWYPPYIMPIPDGSMEIHYARTLDGQQILDPDVFGEIGTGAQAGGDPNQFHGYFVNLQLNFDTPKSLVTMRFAQYGASQGGFLYSTMAANKERVQLKNGFESANGLVLGVTPDQQVEITSTLTSVPNPNEGGLHVGTLEFSAFPNSRINSLTLGSVQYYLDDICLTD